MNKPQPTFDSEGYPTDETLQTITDWPIRSNEDIGALLAYVEKAWRYTFTIGYGGIGRTKSINIATHGWSGNETIIHALKYNPVFWGLCWLSSSRGGGHRFLVAPIAEPATNEE